jgi:hypothetical protein
MKGEFEEKEYWVHQQQRFEAALKFATSKTWCKSEFTTLSIFEAVERADELLARLEETRTKTNEDTPF